MKIFAILYSVICYAIGVAALIALILFIADLFLPVTLSSGSAYSPGFSGVMAVIWNVGLVALWGYQHTLMASPGFKKRWTQIVPASVERSTYLVFVGLFTAMLILLWVPMNQVIWDVSGTGLGTVLWVLYFAGWTITLLSTFMINHFHLFGLQQAFQGIADTQSKTATFTTPLFYKLVRHPIMTGVFIALWSAPTMTTGRLVLNLAMTAYIFIGIKYEEKTLIADLGQEYLDYKKSTAALIPGFKGRS